MEEYKAAFIETALQAGALKFGEFTLKSKRLSPYFFKADSFNTGDLLRSAGNAYSQAIITNNIPGNIIFGPAYKGIPLATAAVVSLAEAGKNASFSADRKEVKDHGDGGNFLGVKPDNETIIIDDVITSGTSINGAIEFIKSYSGIITGAVVMVDRQERGLTSDLSAIQEVENNHGIKVYSVVTVKDILEYTRHNPQYDEYAPKIAQYHKEYGVQLN